MIQNEVEVFDKIKTNIKSAIDDCELIVKNPESGAAFVRMRESLKTIEECCVQMGQFREDYRWFSIGMVAEEAHQRARTWLHRPSVSSKKLFALLASGLKNWLRDIERLKTRKTGRVGMILPAGISSAPTVSPAFGLRSTPGGIILP